MERVRWPIDGNEIQLRVNLHTKTDLGKWGAPVGGQLGFKSIKPSCAVVGIEAFVITPQLAIIVKRHLPRKYSLA